VSRSEFNFVLNPQKESVDVGRNVYETQGIANFRRFFEWFRVKEDLENETRLSENNIEYRDPQLQAVRKAIEAFMPEVSDLRVKRNPLRMEVQKGSERLIIDQLSLGERSMLALAGDLARRFAIHNPLSPNPLEGVGIVLIDEIDLHLHPQWQRSIIQNLTHVFPNCQFIVSTHSPQVIGEVNPSCLRILGRDHEGKMTVSIPEASIGLDSAEILSVIMETRIRNEVVDAKLMEIFGKIDAERFDEARTEIQSLKAELNGSIPEIVRAETMIAILEP
jgi:predicted ATP-binding protein involved in virulence